ncbi:MAG TPA: hypothetical protein VGT40_24150 [Methylomirabilota bacterium]|jgi:hypothetical protein|nr:hypothetical protein [Methylomirabilota bacterium]
MKLVLAALIVVSVGCASGRIEPPYTEKALQATCERQGGRWLGDDIRGFGSCEYPSMN